MSRATTPASGALADLLAHSTADEGQVRDARRQLRALLIPVIAAAGLFAAWSASAPLAGAVVAPALLKAEYKRKTVQHLEGGIVREILVRDGQTVRAGDPLLVIGDLRQESDLHVLQDQLGAARLRVARTEAESRFAPRFEVPDDLRDSEHLAREKALFAARRQAIEEQATLVEAQVQQAQAQAAALDSQIEAIGASEKLSNEELAINEKLVGQGFVSRARLIGLQRTAIDYRSKVGEARGEQAAARQRIAELRARAAQLRIGYQTQATDELKDAALRVREIEERLRPSRDQVERQIVRAPVDGDVMSLRVAAAGAIVAPREPLLDVVPRREKLVVEARIEPQDIDHVRVGGTAEVRLLTNDASRSPLLPATVTYVSADRVTQGETGRSWFEVTVEVDADAFDKRRPLPRLQAGMPAELYVTTGDRTLVEYLMKPLRSFSQRALREPG